MFRQFRYSKIVFPLFLILFSSSYLVPHEQKLNYAWAATNYSASSCTFLGGQYIEFKRTNEVACNFKTNDKGKLCRDNSECTGYCLAEKNVSIKSVSAGRCSERIFPTGCTNQISNGTASWISAC